VTLAAFALCVWVGDFMLEMIFESAWELAHTRPFPDGFFPEGWPIYGYLAAYASLGATLVWAVGVVPRKQTPQR
jgi:hypothetical protein